MSWWTKLRDAIEHAVVTTAKASAPTLEVLGANAGKAVLAAVASKGIAHGTDDAIHAARDSILSDAPHMEITLATALASSVAAELHSAAMQQQDDPGKPPGE